MNKNIWQGTPGLGITYMEPVVSVKNPTLIPITHPLASRKSESVTTGSGSSFSVGDGEQCGVLHGDYRFPIRNPVVRRSPSYFANVDNLVLDAVDVEHTEVPDFF